ncbi:ABC transporter permease [Halorubellus salinus]|uniref:ABC transporter permease n=1 Tax=Halorubellus salinus TaxID=755309 RepID=UPI001D0717A9|nr:ABC transporter permease [Halorubellus salinus]
MSRVAYLLRRSAGLALTVWAAFTLVFAYIVLTPFTEGLLASEQVPASPSDPLLAQYVDWLAWLVTIWDDPILGTVLGHLSYTVAYLVPALVFAVVVGVATRVYTIGREGTTLDSYVTAVAIVAVSIPVFLLALAMRETLLVPFFEVFDTIRIYDRAEGAFSARNLKAALWPTPVMALFLAAIQLRYAGDILEQYASADFVRVARAKGAGSWQVGRHIFRHTAIPLLTVFFTDMLGMLVLSVFVVEYIFGVPGIGELTIEAILAQDLPLVLALVVLTVLTGVLANFVQDIAYLLYDPRVDLHD